MSAEIKLISPERISRAFFTALLLACKGEDKQACDILRSIADEMTKEFLPAKPSA